MTDHKDLIERVDAMLLRSYEVSKYDRLAIVKDITNALEAAQQRYNDVISERPYIVGWNDGFGYCESGDETKDVPDVVSALVSRQINAVWAEATAAAYGAAADIADHYADADYCAMGYPEEGGIAASGTADTIRRDIRSLTPQSARDWLAEREAAIRADERAKVIERVSASKQTYAMALPGSDEEFNGVMFGMQRALDVIRNQEVGTC